MPAPRVSSTYSETIKDISVLLKYRSLSLSLDSVYQNFVAEVIMLRLFSLLENCCLEVASKLACEAPYRNGRVPRLMMKCNSLSDAERQFKTYNRRRSLNKLKWTNATFVSGSVREIIPSTEPFLISINNHSLIFEEMRIVRNQIAHRTKSTYTQFKTVINSTFGAYLKIQVGSYLTSNKRLPTPKIDTYLAVTQIILKDITNG
jgi:hypothetical protein